MHSQFAFKSKDSTGRCETYLVHRIDKDIRIVAGCQNEWHNPSGKTVFNHTVDRKYYALVWGSAEEERIINAHIRKIPRTDCNDQFPDGEDGRHVTHWKLGNSVMLPRGVQIGNRKTHQIRIHMKSIGHPLLICKIW